MISTLPAWEQSRRGLHVRFSLFASLVAISSLLNAPVTSLTIQQDVNALRALQAAWGGKPSTWDFSTDPCDTLWLGVGCDDTHTRVTQLLLINQDLTGTLPSSIGDLTNLTNLDLSSNAKLGGSLPTEISNLKNLQRLFIQFCNLSGQIPTVIGNLTSLSYLGLTQNSLSGTLPDTIGFLSNLFWLDVSSNQLTGALPDSTTSPSGSGLDNLTNARHFHLENNSFSGTIPTSIFNTQMQLIHLLLHNNMLTGNIPTAVGNLIHMEIMHFDSNALNGSVPSGFSSIQNLTTLHLDNNQLGGQLPDLSNATNLQMLYLGSNNFTSAPIPSWISNLKKLFLLSMDSANLFGNISADIFSSSSNISNVTFASNSLNGTVDLSSANSRLRLVNLSNNDLAGFVNSPTTVQIILDGNPYCDNNQGQCDSLRAATPTLINASACSGSCADNYLINPKLSTTCQCSRPVVGNVDFLATKLPILEDYNLTLMEEEFASGLSQSAFMNITFLDFQVVVNTFTATHATVSIFPPNNTATWSPSDAALISYAIKNQEITYPGIGPMVCAFIGTPYDAVIIVSGLTTGAKVGIAIGVVVFVVAVVVLGLYAIRQRKRADKAEEANKPFAAWIATGEGGDANIPQLKGARWFSLEEIRKCTNNFSQSNEIGEGGYGKVYKGYLASGEKVAIKRAGTDSLQGAAEFKNEIELLSRVHHRNLVGLIGFCFEEGEQMLVYEFMPNGTLRESLSGTTGIQMNWERRLSLAMSSARGIAYLHTEANPPIIHRDIKSSNILLDDKLVAKVADFGLSKVAPTDDGVAPLSTQVKGTLGYLDPDYFMTNRLTEKSDVYSFGVVLLELMTGRLPIQGGKYVVREMRVALAQEGMAQGVKSMVDPELKEYPLEALEKLVELALACVEDSPESRPTMAEVIKEIESLSEVTSAKPEFQGNNEYSQEDKLAYMQQNLGSPFDYSGSYTAFYGNVQPK
ncbi:hypothetical protein GOP47_0018502 [Adiantum capillus-veneris]|uniref:non-specific serine/threonine protein kinase n=1 Tax=Adiantum capillus-veneris TaxID=13818 RepID=A0A9D4UD85_ADICA|nr:hypothetical protein GOP47_0018502 [Adiantum capillus-veneris]